MTINSFLICLAVVAAIPSLAQNQKPAAPLTYGEPIKLEQAEKVMAAALEEAKNNNWMMAIAIVDTSGKLVLFKKIDNTQIGSVDVAIGKATTANNFKRPSKVFEDAVAGGGIGLRILSLPGVTPLEGGELIMFNGKIIGAIGVSGAQSTQDGQVARAGASVIK
ncbi:MAG: heme-binding protein [Bacteroidetes bacterium]|nr:heme-binding protein [Bacteroidota bacterium]